MGKIKNPIHSLLCMLRENNVWNQVHTKSKIISYLLVSLVMRARSTKIKFLRFLLLLPVFGESANDQGKDQKVGSRRGKQNKGRSYRIWKLSRQLLNIEWKNVKLLERHKRQILWKSCEWALNMFLFIRDGCPIHWFHASLWSVIWKKNLTIWNSGIQHRTVNKRRTFIKNKI